MKELVARVEAGAFALGPVRARAMFGGQGVYIDDLMVALIAGDALYLKTGPGNRADFDALDLPPFTYVREGRRVSLSYCLAPAGDLSSWLEGALAEARRSRRKKADKTNARRGF